MTASWFLVALRHDRAVVLGSLAFVVLLAWSYLLLGAGLGPEMMDMGAGQMMAMPPEWSLGYGLVIFVMWAVMMLAMMLPSAASVTLLIARKVEDATRPRRLYRHGFGAHLLGDVLEHPNQEACPLAAHFVAEPIGRVVDRAVSEVAYSRMH